MNIKSPCTKDCPERNYIFCRTCEKLKQYELEKNLKYKEQEAEQKQREFDASIYHNKVKQMQKKRR